MEPVEWVAAGIALFLVFAFTSGQMTKESSDNARNSEDRSTTDDCEPCWKVKEWWCTRKWWEKTYMWPYLLVQLATHCAGKSCGIDPNVRPECE